MHVFFRTPMRRRVDARVFGRLGAVWHKTAHAQLFQCLHAHAPKVALEWICGLLLGWRGALLFARWVHCCLGRSERECGSACALKCLGARVLGPHCHCILGALCVRGAWNWTDRFL